MFSELFHSKAFSMSEFESYLINANIWIIVFLQGLKGLRWITRLSSIQRRYSSWRTLFLFRIEHFKHRRLVWFTQFNNSV